MTISIAPLQRHLKLLTYSVILVLFSLMLKLPYTYIVIKQFGQLPAADQISYHMGYLVQDTPSYVQPAIALTKGNVREAISLIRPIGYPAFLALLGLQFDHILYTQALVLSIIPVCTFLLVRAPTGNDLLGFVAGLVSCISPTGIALGAMVSSDALFSALFAILFTALIYGALRSSLRWILFSAVVSGLAVLVRPILTFWPVISVMIFAVISGFQEGFYNGLRLWRRIYKEWLPHMLALFFIPAIFMGSFAAANYAANGIFTVSIIGNMAVRICLAVEAEEWGKGGHWPTRAAIQQNATLVRERWRAMTEQEQAQTFLPESIAIFKKYPAETIKSFTKNAFGEAVGGWNYYSEQLPFSQAKLGSLFSVISDVESGLRWIGLLVILVAPFIGLNAMRFNPSPYEFRIVSVLFGMTLTFICYFVLLGVTFWTGPRIIYPVEIMQISSAAMLVAVLRKTTNPLHVRRRVGLKLRNTADPI
jgi:hypothetical protein